DDSGTYRFDKLAPDVYVVSSMAFAGAGRVSVNAQTVTVQANQVAHLDIDVSQGTVTLAVKVAAPPEANVHTAQVFLASGTILARTAEELSDAINARGAGASYSAISFKDEAAKLEKVRPGAYSACVIPIPGDVNSPADMMRLSGRLDKLIAVCVP